jgi:hypothetical protein
VSAGIRIANTTIESQRSSFIVTVQPNQRGYLLGGVSVPQLSINPSYRVTTKAFESVLEVSWMPRLEDMAYWHTATLTAQNSFEWAGLIVAIDNSSGFSQTYSAETVFNYELAGEFLLSVGDESVHLPAEKAVVEPALNVLRLGEPDSSSLLHTASIVAAQAASHPMAARLGQAIMGKLSEGASAAVANMFA